MKDIFSPVFLLALLFLFVVREIAVPAVLIRAAAALLFLLAMACFRKRRFRFSLALLLPALALLFPAGFIRQQERYVEAAAMDYPADRYLDLTGRLDDFPEIGNGRSVLLLRADGENSGGRPSVRPARPSPRRPVRLRITVAGDCRHLNRGDRIAISARISRPRLAVNFFANPFADWFCSRNIHFTGFCKSVGLIELKQQANLFWRLIGRWRNRIRDRIEARYLSRGILDDGGVFLEATLLGDRSRLEPEKRDELVAAGVFHLIAISGANIAMIAVMSLWLLSWARVPLRWRYALTAGLLVLFLVLSGFDVSARRAVLMALLIFSARIFFMDVEPTNIISFCGILLLAFNPADFLDPGFILTFTLTAAIVLGRHLFLRPLARLPKYLAELLSASLAAMLVSLPLLLFYFKRFAFSGFFSGLLLIPLTALITAGGVLLMPAALVSSTLSRLILAVTDLPLRLFTLITRWSAAVMPLNVYQCSPAPLLVVASLLLYGLLARSKAATWSRRLLMLTLAGLLLAMTFVSPRYRPGRLELYFLNVGQGDCAVAVFPDGRSLLVDGGGSGFGNFQVGRRVVLPFLLQKKIHVNWVAVSHYHPDHVRGLIEIMAVLKPSEVWLSSRARQSDLYRQLVQALPAGSTMRWIGRGFSRRVGACRISLLYPKSPIDADFTNNDHSQVLRIDDGRHSFLLAGDIGAAVEEGLCRQYGARLRASVLKLAHHGSRSSSRSSFLRQVNPELAIISAAAGGDFPHAEVLSNLRRQSIPWLTTGRRGGIGVFCLPDRLAIEVSQ